MHVESNEVVSAVQEDAAEHPSRPDERRCCRQSPDPQLKVPVAIGVGKFHNLLSFPSTVGLKEGSFVQVISGYDFLQLMALLLKMGEPNLNCIVKLATYAPTQRDELECF